MNKKHYSIVDMVVLGILIREPMNAYKLTQFVEQYNIRRLVKLSTPAIYKSCRRIYDQGFVRGRQMRDGEAPEKTIYSVTDSGKDRFKEMMGYFAKTITPFYFDINSVVYSLEQVSFKQGLELIDNYMAEIMAIQSRLIPHSQETPAHTTFANRMIVKQYLMVVDVLVRWTESLREDFIKERG